MELIPLNKPLLSQLESTGQKAERHLKALAQIHVLLHCNTYGYYHRGHKMGLVSRLSRFPQAAAASWGIWAELCVIPSRDHQWLLSQWKQPLQQLPGLSLLSAVHSPCSKPSSAASHWRAATLPGVNDLSHALSGLRGTWGKRQGYRVRILSHEKITGSKDCFLEGKQELPWMLWLRKVYWYFLRQCATVFTGNLFSIEWDLQMGVISLFTSMK